MTSIATQGGKVQLRGGKVCTNCCQNQCDCPQEVLWGSNTQELTFTVDGNTCTKCMSASINAYLSREDNGAFCQYWAEYDLQSCVGSSCRVKVLFEISNFPDCDCKNTAELCDYTVIAWEVVLGACDVTNVTAGAFC